MGWLHRKDQVITADRDVRVSRLVLRKLRAAGYTAQLWDKRDAGGARLVPATLKCGQLWIAVRRVSDVLSPPELEWIAQHGAYVQLGSDDISGLLARLQLINRPHWNA